MSLNKIQASLLLQRGLLPQAQISQALQLLPSHPGHDLCSFLQEKNFLPPTLAKELRQEAMESSGAVRRVSHSSRLVPAVAEPGGQRQKQCVHDLKEILGEDKWFRPHAELLWERIEKLGVGGMGVVYRVRDQCLGRDAALKLLLDESNDLTLKRFLREAAVTARLNHPSIPPVYEAGRVASGQHYMVMKVIEGETLEARMKRNHKRGINEKERRELLQVLARVGEAVSYAHSENIVHRDLKPENIMIGRFGEVLVMDWGVAKDLSQAESTETLNLFDNVVSELELSKLGVTLSGTVVGTPGYMSPEQLEGECVPQSDVFSLGLILTEILTGEKAIRGQSAIERVAATASGNTLRPRAIDRHVPRELDALATEATKIEISERLESAGEFTENLQAYLAGEPLPIYSYSATERFFRWSSRHPGWLVGGTFTVLLLSVSIFVFQFLMESEKDRKEALVIAKQAKSSEKNLKEALEKIQVLENLIRRGAPREKIEAGIEEALKLGGDNYSLILSTAKICRLGALTDLEKRILEDAAEKHPPAYEALFMLHELQLKEGKRDELRVITDAGRTLSKRAQSLGEVNEFTLVLDAVACLKTDDFKKALGILEDLERYSKSFVPGYVLRGQLLVDLGDYEGALQELNKAIKYDQSDSRNFNNRGSIYSELGEKDKAIADYTRAIKLDPKLWLPYSNRARVKIELGDIKGGFEDFAKGIEQNPESKDPLLERARVYYQRGEDEKALKDYEAAVALDRDSATAYLGRGTVFLRMSKVSLAMDDANKAIALDPKLARAYLLRGVVHEVSGRKTTAIEDYTSCIEQDASLADAYRNRARVYLSQGDEDKALEDYNRLIEKRPTADHYLLRIALRIRQKKNEEAIKDCTEALKLKDGVEKIYLQRASLFQAKKELSSAESDLRRALEINPKYVQALFQMGYVYFQKNDFPAALKQLNLVLKYDPKYALAYFGRGQIKEKQGLLREAGLDFEQFVRWAPQDQRSPPLRGLVQRYLQRPCRY